MKPPIVHHVAGKTEADKADEACPEHRTARVKEVPN